MAVDCRARLQTSPAELEVGSAVHLLAEFTKNTVRGGRAVGTADKSLAEDIFV